MKIKYREGRVPVVEGKRVDDLKKALSFAKKTGIPLVAKPDNGVGAANTYKVSSPEEIERGFHAHPHKG